jgi:hypothetical protein
MSHIETTREFFEERLPALFAARPDLVGRSPAKITVFVQGAGQWTLTLSSSPSIVDRPDLDADLIVTWTADQFAQVLTGEAVPPAVSMGDQSRLETLGCLMLPPARGGLGARLMVA